MANRSRNLDRSTASTVDDGYHPDNKEMTFFWSIMLTNERRSHTWAVEIDKGDAIMVHSLSLKAIVLGPTAVEGEQNIIVLQSPGHDGKVQKGIIANVARGVNPMETLHLTISGTLGCTFTLSEGKGPVTIAGSHWIAFREDKDIVSDYGDITTDEEMLGHIDNEDEEEDDSEEENKGKKAAKRKATPKAAKQKQKAKMDVDEDDQSEDDDDDDEDEEKDDDDDDDDEEEEYEEKKTKQAKKGKALAKKVDKGKMKQEKESGKKGIKAVKK